MNGSVDLAWRIDLAVGRLAAVQMAIGTRGKRSFKPKDYMPVWPGMRPKYPTAEELQLKMLAWVGGHNQAVALAAQAGR